MLNEDEIEKARRLVKEADERRATDERESLSKNRAGDRKLTKPYHFHATIFTYESKDENGNFKGSTHQDVMGISVEGVIRRARNRAEPKQVHYFLSVLAECPDPTHSTREMVD